MSATRSSWSRFSGCDDLTVAGSFDPRQVCRVDDVNEAEWPTAVLHVRPAALADLCEVEAVLLG
jgi:hypothetical protein